MTVLLPFEMKHAYAISESTDGKLYTAVKPSDMSKQGGSSAVRCVRQVYNYMNNNGEDESSICLSILFCELVLFTCQSTRRALTYRDAIRNPLL